MQIFHCSDSHSSNGENFPLLALVVHTGNWENSTDCIFKNEKYCIGHFLTDRVAEGREAMKIIGHFCSFRPGDVFTEMAGRYYIQLVGEFLGSCRSFEVITNLIIFF